MSIISELEKKLNSIKERRDDLFAIMKPIQEELSTLYKEMTLLGEEITKAKFKIEMTEQERFDFLMEENGSSNMVLYNAANEYIVSLGLYMSGYCPFSQQKTSEVFIYKFNHEKNVKTIESLKKLVSLYKPMDEDGNKFFKVFCQDSRLVFNSDNSIFFEQIRYKQEFETLESFFAYYIAHCACYDDDFEES